LRLVPPVVLVAVSLGQYPVYWSLMVARFTLMALLVALAAVGGNGMMARAQSGSAPGVEKRPGVRAGDELPDVTLPRVGGGTARVAELRGRAAVIAFSARWCAPCHQMLPVIARLVERLARDAHLQISLWVVAVDGEPDPGMVERLGPGVVWVLDPRGDARLRFGPEIYPCTFIADARGIVRRVHPGYGDRYERHIERWLRIVTAAR
jgi:thiol-disulfide isomerase/thioredoxin